VYEFGTPEYERLLPLDKRQIASRAIIMVDIIKVATVGSFSVQFSMKKALNVICPVLWLGCPLL